MNIKKLTLGKIGLLAILAVGLFTMSCEKEELEIESPEATTKEKIKPVSKPVVFDYKFQYNGQTYDEKQWNTKFDEIGKDDLSVIALNDVAYVFDNVNEAKQFENQELPLLMDKKPVLDDSFSSKVDQIIGQVYIQAKIELFKDKNYDGRYGISIHYFNRTVTKRRTWWGWDYYENNEYNTNIVSFFRKQTTSYRATFIKGGRLDTSGASTSSGYAKMNFDLRAGLLEDGGPRWRKDLRKNPYFPGGDVSEDGDLSNNRIWGVLGLTNWDNQIQSIKLKFISG